MEAQVYTYKATEAKKITLPSEVFGVPWNADLVHQVVTSIEGNKRTPVAHTKNRGEVSGGGKKPWQQKGTGRARHGSIRSPLWVGGGVTHGPRNEKDYSRKINKKMKAKALYAVLSQKLKEGKVIFVDSLPFAAPKTAEAKTVLSAFSKLKTSTDLLSKRKNSVVIALDKKSENTQKSFRNFSSLLVDEVRNLNAAELLKYKYVMIVNPEESLATLSAKLK